MATHLLTQDEVSEKMETGKAAKKSRGRFLAKIGAVLGLLVFELVVASGTSPVIGYAAFPGANGQIAFVSGRDGNHEVYVMNADGSGQTNLSNHPAVDMDPVWSPDGTRIAFRSTRSSNDEIYVMNGDGSGLTNLSNHPALDLVPAWSPDGTQIAFISSRDGNAEIYVMNADGSDQTRLTNNPAIEDYPAWSPDGTRIAFESRRDGNAEIYVMNADGSDQTRLTNNPAFDSEPAWSPDGTKIAFFSNRDSVFNHEIYVMNANGSGLTRLTNHPGLDQSPAWSPDGTQIAFHNYSFQDDNHEIYVMNANGSGLTRLTNRPRFDVWPDWQPVPTPPNVAPLGAADQAMVAVNESETVANTGTYSDANAGDDVTIIPSVGIVTKMGTNTGTWNWSFATTDGPIQSQIVTLTFDDGQGGVSTTAFMLTVNNVVPVVEAGLEATIIEGETFSSSGFFTDPGADSWTGAVDYGDGSGSQLLSLNSDKTFSLNHLYLAGVYTVIVNITDDDGGTASDSVMVTVLTHQQVIEHLIDDVNMLITMDVLNQGQGNALIAKLEAAIQQLNKGNVNPAINQLQAFINQVNGFVNGGVLSLEEGQPLIEVANGIITALSG